MQGPKTKKSQTKQQKHFDSHTAKNREIGFGPISHPRELSNLRAGCKENQETMKEYKNMHLACIMGEYG